MLLSEIGDKEVVDIVSGTMHGKLWDAEMLFDEKDGTIKSLIEMCIRDSSLPVFNRVSYDFFQHRRFKSFKPVYIPYPAQYGLSLIHIFLGFCQICLFSSDDNRQT